jgi:hypothetical protein
VSITEYVKYRDGGEAMATEHHERTEMAFVGKDAQKHRYSNGREKNVWYRVFKCPVCGAVKRPLQNTSRGKAFYCEGTTLSREEKLTRGWRCLRAD